jgi:Cys-rich four helix bundle protein (predicted Tat secretion target)
MHRRDFIGAVATVAVSSGAILAASAPAPALPTAIRATGIEAGPAALEAAAGACIGAAEQCLRHCFGELTAENTTMAGCAGAAYELVTACRSVRAFTAVGSAHVAIFAKALEQVGIACKQECERFPGIEACDALAQACDRCIEACRSSA